MYIAGFSAGDDNNNRFVELNKGTLYGKPSGETLKLLTTTYRIDGKVEYSIECRYFSNNLVNGEGT